MDSKILAILGGLVASILVMSSLVSCGSSSAVARKANSVVNADGRAFLRSYSRIDQDLDNAPLIDYILALPAFHVHEEPVGEFRARLEKARDAAAQSNLDSLKCGQDSRYGEREFTLDRESRTLVVSHLPGTHKDGVSVGYQRTAGGWYQSSPIYLPHE